ncbi:hypothetical protein OUZ56_023657 [Daphnia magna]|uniref:Uncharacterized protein n=1 Tax=Daphnia magna TaxID=35525 RepID=A0ABR0AZY7_9CRUS|nr:hypothetical protein OUZ56_023657 [Daphnia magna]
MEEFVGFFIFRDMENSDVTVSRRWLKFGENLSASSFSRHGYSDFGSSEFVVIGDQRNYVVCNVIEKHPLTHYVARLASTLVERGTN